MASKYYFSTRDLMLIAVISSLGGVLSTYVGYLGNMLNNLFGVPFGAGQFMAGLHIFWIMLIYGLTKKKGTAILAGTLKGFVEFLSGGAGHIGRCFDSVPGSHNRCGVPVHGESKSQGLCNSGGISTAANILFFQLAFVTYEA